MALVISRPVGPLQCNMAIIADPQSKEGVLVDPGGDAELIISLIEEHQVIIKQILITHAHFDHILASDIMSNYTGAPVFYHPADRKLWLSLPLQCMIFGLPQPEKTLKPPSNTFSDGDSFTFRGGRVIHTPGHTEGSCCFYFSEDNLLCTGDTLFQGSVGRTDLPGGNTQLLISSIRDKLFVLPENTRVITGHGDETTIGIEKSTNPFMQGGF